MSAAAALVNSALNAVLKVFEPGKTGAPGAVVSTIKVLVAAGAGDSFPAVSVAVPFRISILMVPLPVKLFKVTVRVTVPLVSVPETSKLAFAVPVLISVTCELARMTPVTPS